MRNKLLIIPAILILVLTNIACVLSEVNYRINSETVKGSGNLQTETRELDNVNSVSLTSIGDMTIIVADEEKLEIEAEENLISLITSEVNHGELTIAVKNNTNIQPTESIHYTLYVTEPLESLSVTGLGSIYTKEITTEKLALNLPGAGDIKIDHLAAERLDVNISGLGSIYINDGETYSQTIKISGSGTLEAEDLFSQEAEIQISGLGNANVWVEDQLIVEISGAGNISYYGSPSVSQHISGIGSLDHKGEH